MALEVTFYIIAGLIAATYFWFKQRYNYWKEKGIPYVEPTFLVGNLKEVFSLKQSLSLHISDLYNKPQFANAAVVGIYALHQPGLVIRDLDLIKGILIKDFNKFSNRYSQCDPYHDPLGSYNLFFVRNPQWRELRTKLSPVFTSGKLKQAYGLMQEVSLKLEEHFKSKQAASGDAFVCDIKESIALFTTDLIATHAFGVQANSLENPNGDFRSYGRKIFEFDIRRFVDFFVIFFMPNLTSLLRVHLFSGELSKFFRDTVNYVMKERRRTGAVRNDLIDTLLALQEEANAVGNEKHFAKNMDYLVAQAAVYFTAGFETSSSTISFAFYELARNPDVQERLRKEINEAFIAENGVISYEKLISLEYLNMVLDEVLRLYPIMPFLDRLHQNSDSKEAGFSLKPHYNYELADGTPVFISVYGIHHDEQYWPDAEKFDPERFSIENRKTHHPMAYMPFGIGPRNCIGMRVGLLQSRLGLVHLLKNYSVRTCAETIKEPKFEPKLHSLQFIRPIKLEIVYDGLYDKSVSK